MRRIQLLVLFATGLLFSACPPSDRYNPEKKIHDNNNNLPDLIKETYDGISFQLTSLLEYDYSNYYTLKSDAFSRSNYDLGLHFSVESFNSRDVGVIKFAFDQEMTDLEAVHTYYMRKREESLEYPFTSERKDIHKAIGLNGFIQVIEGGTYEESVPNTYFTATFKVDTEIYVMQMIGKSGNMDYLYDDFLNILRSVN